MGDNFNDFIFIVQFYPLHFDTKVIFFIIDKVRQFHEGPYEKFLADRYEICNIHLREKFFVDIPIRNKTVLGTLFFNYIKSHNLKRLSLDHKVLLPFCLLLGCINFFIVIDCHI